MKILQQKKIEQTIGKAKVEKEKELIEFIN